MVPYLNNLTEEALFGSNKIKKQYETMKLQNEEFHVLPIKVALLMRRRSERGARNCNQKVLVHIYTENFDKKMNFI